MFVKILKQFLILLIRCYQVFISPIIPPRCRFHPTCSQYAVQAIQVHGIIKGLKLSVKRILCCHPLGNSGYDPVPEPLSINATNLTKQKKQIAK